ncbi:UDP-glucuronic acid decarboxylase 1 [Paramuricea clavata]|uniref:UDP-glucuronic acid decarboxylase 1 n=2 Tax=Paramuricea clavata TaxID=317549 RepID=A0A6S7KB90_PARCT|nr:UDP-glucuronic acid decarboxylase 1 [Paramuricea clavata]
MNSNISSPVNLGNPSEHTIKEFAVMIRNRVGNNSSKIVTQEAQQDDPRKRKPDINKAKKYLNWEPKVDLMRGLDKTIRFFRNELARLNEQKEL